MDEIVLPVFYIVDTISETLDKEKNSHKINCSGRKCSITKSEIMTICILFHFSGYWNFKRYYKFVLKNMNGEFPKLVSYSRFISLMKEIKEELYYLILSIPKFLTGNYIVDATAIKVCHNKRIYSNKVFKGIAKIGKSTMGWFFGLKLHVIINDLGEIMNFTITEGNVDDRFVVPNLTENLHGKLFADKGYISADLFKSLWSAGLHLIHAIKKNMKAKILTKHDSDKLKKRNFIETIFNVLKNNHQIAHTRHRSPKNSYVNILSGLAAYSLKKFYDLYVKNNQGKCDFLIAN